tara:strand:+ start:103 stop:729 length:627 start_codon:yes stop_codon:yes gene_type:complete
MNSGAVSRRDEAGNRFNGPLQEGKRSTFEGGLRVPFVVSGPGIKPGSQCDVPVVQWDLLLNIPIRADGTLDETATNLLEEMGDWLRVNGEGIYGTRPWYVFGEGKVNEIPKFVVESPYTWRDVRYTTRGEYLYAYVLAWPPKNRPHVELALLAPGNQRLGSIQSVEMLGHDGDLKWQHHPDGLRVTFPNEKPCDFAYGLKIHLTKKAE